RRQRLRVTRQPDRLGQPRQPGDLSEVVITRLDSGLNGFAYRNVDARLPRGRRQGGGDDGLADPGPRPGDDQNRQRRPAHSTSVSTVRASSRSSESSEARAVSRSRAVPAGTGGGRKQPTRTPASRQATAAASAASGSPRITDTTADCGNS